MAYRALLIGNGSFPEDPHNLPKLVGPKNDVQQLCDALTHEQVGLHKPDDVATVFDSTRIEICDALYDFFGTAARDDQLLLYYSGHGRLDKYGNLYLAASNTRTDRLHSSAISDQVINGIIEDSTVRRVVIILDCCYSGAFKGVDIPETLRGAGRFLITSCQSSDLSEDARTVGGASAFTHHLVEALLASEVDTDRDGYVSLAELYNHVLPRLKESTGQIPQRFLDKTVGDLPLGRTLGGEREPPDVTAPVRLDVSHSVIEIRDVKQGEQIPEEIIDVFDAAGGKLEWEYECSADWLALERVTGGIKVNFNPAPGRNRANIFVRALPRGGRKTIRVDVEMERVESPPRLELTEGALDFGRITQGAEPEPQTIHVANRGGGSLEFEAETSDERLALRRFGDVIEVRPDTSRTGALHAMISIKSNGGDATVPVSAQIEQGPVLEVSQRKVNFGQLEMGQSKRIKIAIQNGGKGDLDWSYSTEDPFYTVQRVDNGLVFAFRADTVGTFRSAVRIRSNGGEATLNVTARVTPEEQTTTVDPSGVLTGQWRTPDGTTVVIAGGPSQFSFQEYNIMGVVVSQGAVTRQGNLVQLQGHNFLVGALQGQFTLQGTALHGTITNAMGVFPVTMMRIG